MKSRALVVLLSICVLAAPGVSAAETQEHQRLWEKVNTSFQDPAELTLLDMGGDFQPVEKSPQRSRAFKNRVRSLMGDASAVWEEPGTGVLLLAGRQHTDANEILMQTRDEFIRQLVVIGQVSKQPYERFENSRAEAEVIDKGNVLILKMTAVFDGEGQPRMHQRHSYYFRPDYVLHLVLAGPLDDALRMSRQFKDARQAFEQKLGVLYEGGIRFVDA